MCAHSIDVHKEQQDYEWWAQTALDSYPWAYFQILNQFCSCVQISNSALWRMDLSS